MEIALSRYRRPDLKKKTGQEKKQKSATYLSKLLIFCQKKERRSVERLYRERKTRLELATPTLARSCSTN